MLHSAISDVLSLKGVQTGTTNDDALFFDIGGDSLSAVQLVQVIKQKYVDFLYLKAY